MWTRFSRQVPGVPEGLDEGSLAVYCQGMRLKKTRPVGYGLSWSTPRSPFKVEERSSGPIIPFPTGRVQFLAFPGSKLPGYLHLVPSGQKLS